MPLFLTAKNTTVVQRRHFVDNNYPIIFKPNESKIYISTPSSGDIHEFYCGGGTSINTPGILKSVSASNGHVTDASVNSAGIDDIIICTQSQYDNTYNRGAGSYANTLFLIRE